MVGALLSAFEPLPLLEFKQRDKSKIETLLAYGDRLLLGLYSGSLRVYRVNDPEDTSSESKEDADDEARPTSSSARKPAELLREIEKFSRYKIEQLAVIRQAGVLLSLSNGFVNIYDLQSYEFREALQKTKGATTFAITPTSTKATPTSTTPVFCRLAVAVKRKLVILTWKDGEFGSDSSELTLATGIKTLLWATDEKLIAGLTSSYVMVDVTSSTVTDIVGPGSIGGAPGQDGGRFGGAGVAGMSYLGISAPTPLIAKLSEGHMLLAKDINTHFIDMDANPLDRRQIPWAIAPEAVGYYHPYLLALQTARGALEIRNPQTLTLLQTISLPAASRLHVPQSSLGGAHLYEGFLVASDRTIWRMKPLDSNSQVDALIQRGSLDEAISLVGLLQEQMLSDKDGKLREAKMLKAQVLFDQYRFRESIDLFSDVSAPPDRVIALYPPFIAGDASAKSPYHGVIVNTGAASAASHSVKPEEATSKESPAEDADDAKQDQQNLPADKALEGKDLKLATEELRGFLVSARTKLKRVLNNDGSLNENGLQNVPSSELAALLGKRIFDESADQARLVDTAKLVDTTLFRAYMFVSPSFAGPLFRIDNFCDPDVVNEKLTEAERYNDLVDFFYGKKLHRQALELLQRFGDVEQEDPPVPQLAGPRRTVGYLQSMPPDTIELILQFAKWPLKLDPELGMDVFLADTENAESLPRGRVVSFLRDIDERLAVRYLEHIIHELNDTTPDFHQTLINSYISRMKAVDFASEGERLLWHEKTVAFLRGSRYYQAYKVLGLLDKDDPNLYEARAVVLSNMGQHKQALDIFVFKLKDADKTEEYCNQIYARESSYNVMNGSPSKKASSPIADPEEDPPSIYHTLLSLYLVPPPPHKPQWGPALIILAKHGARVPASSTLSLIPETLPVHDLESYFRGRVRAANTVLNEGRIVAGLRSALSFNEDAKLRLGEGVPGGNDGRNRRAVITEEKVCGICHKRLGGSAIKILPTNTIVHYGCSSRS